MMELRDRAAETNSTVSYNHQSRAPLNGFVPGASKFLPLALDKATAQK